MPHPPKHRDAGPPPDRDGRRAVDALIATVPLLSRLIERRLANLSPPLTPTQFLTLDAIGKGVASGAELARSAGVSAPAVSQVVSSLTVAGLIERTELAEDRRRQALRLSARGVDVLDEVRDSLRAELTPLVAPLPRPEVDAVVRALATIEAVLAGVTPPRRPHRPPPPHGPPPHGAGPPRDAGPAHPPPRDPPAHGHPRGPAGTGNHD